MWHTFVLLKTLNLVSVKSFIAVEIPGTTQCHVFLKSSVAPEMTGCDGDVLPILV